MPRWMAIAMFAALAAPAPAQDPPPPQPLPEDPGRPVLRRGGPASKHEQVPALPPEKRLPPQVGTEVVVDEHGRTEQVIRPANAPPPSPTESLIDRARAAAFEFDAALPNFICDQHVLRWESKTLTPKWKLRDRVQVEVMYMGGKEDYRNVRINGKPVKKGSPEDSGTWSSGEFGTVLASLLASNTNAAFRPRGDSTAAGLPAKVFDYSVAQPNANWTVRFGRSVKPAYKGAIWIDPQSARVLRIEMNSKQLPSDYEIDTVETTVDYGWVNVGGQKLLLPVKSENLACLRGTFNCTRNEIEFRNYRRFQVESQVLQVDSDITFPEAGDPQKQGAKTPDSKTTPPSITPEPAKKKKD